MKTLKIILPVISSIILVSMPFIPSTVCISPKPDTTVKSSAILSPALSTTPPLTNSSTESKSPSALDTLINAGLCFLYTYKLWVIIACGTFMTVSYLKLNIWDSRKIYQAVIYNQLEDIMEDCFENKQAQIRISIFTKAKWSEAIGHYIKHVFAEAITRTLPLKSFLPTLKTFRIPFSHHLIIFSRVGTPNPTIHSTIFAIPNDAEKVEGIVGLAWKSRRPVVKSLPDISNIDFKKYKKFTDIQDASEQSSVETYMKEGNITFNKLKSIHRPSVGFWACLINDPRRKPWGVIVIDSSEVGLIENCEQEKLKQYVNKIQGTINRHYREL
jgi:hypothetical protein